VALQAAQAKPMVVARQSIQDDWWWTFWTGTDYGFSGSVAFSVLLCRSPEGGPIYVLDEFPRDLAEPRKIDVKKFAREHYKARCPDREKQISAKLLHTAWLVFGGCFPHDPSGSLAGIFLVCAKFSYRN
jgi:hypothetical protein